MTLSCFPSILGNLFKKDDLLKSNTGKSKGNKKVLKKYGSSSIDPDDRCKKLCYRKFTVGYSTERHFRIGDDEEPHFYGAYGNIRKELDYSYHVHYRKGS